MDIEIINELRNKIEALEQRLEEAESNINIIEQSSDRDTSSDWRY